MKPPVPQPQLKYRFLTGVLPMIGLASGHTSTMPPHWRSMRRREKMGKSSISAPICSSITGRLPRCA